MLATALNSTETIARLNDRVRQGLDRTAKVVMTSNLLAHLSDGSLPGRILAQAKLMKAVRNCTFSPDSPERDFARFEVDGVTVLMKVDLYEGSFVNPAGLAFRPPGRLIPEACAHDPPGAG